MPYIVLKEEKNEFETGSGEILFDTEKETIEAAINSDAGFDLSEGEVIVAEVIPKYIIKLGAFPYEKKPIKQKTKKGK